MRSLLGLLFLLFVQLSSALKFDLSAVSGKNERCIRNFVFKDQLVVVTAIVSGNKGDGQVVNMHVRGNNPGAISVASDRASIELAVILEGPSKDWGRDTQSANYICWE